MGTAAEHLSYSVEDLDALLFLYYFEGWQQCEDIVPWETDWCFGVGADEWRQRDSRGAKQHSHALSAGYLYPCRSRILSFGFSTPTPTALHFENHSRLLTSPRVSVYTYCGGAYPVPPHAFSKRWAHCSRGKPYDPFRQHPAVLPQRAARCVGARWAPEISLSPLCAGRV